MDLFRRFVMDIGDIDVSLEEIAYQKEDNLRDSVRYG